MRKSLLVLVSVGLIGGCAPPSFEPTQIQRMRFQPAWQAEQRGDHAAALGIYEDGIAYAQYRVARMYENGQGTATDHAQAARWYAAAYAAGHRPRRSGDAKGLFRLGEAYERGNGVAADPVRALMWYRLADEQGYERAAERVQQVSERLDAEQRQQVEVMAAEWRRTNEAR